MKPVIEALGIMKPDPKLKEAMKEITRVLEKHDIGGHIILSSQSHGEYFLHLPSWSKADGREQSKMFITGGPKII